jgi:hypothetical protein
MSTHICVADVFIVTRVEIAIKRSAHDSGCRLARGLHVHPYVSAQAVTGPKVQRHDGAGVGPARSAARGQACSSTRLDARRVYLGERRYAPTVTEEAQACSASRLARQWYLDPREIMLSQRVMC